MFKVLSVLALLLLSGCSREFIESIYEVDYTTTNRFANNLAPLPGQFEKDISALDSLISHFTGNVQRHWGDDVLIAGKRDYVKYTDNYQSRAHVDFTRGVVTISTVAKTQQEKHLRQAIVTTLLTPEDPAGVDLYSSSDIHLEGQPFLFEQVLDQDGQAIAWEWRANRFADHLIDNQLQRGKVRFQNSLYVEIPMVANHADRRGYKYANIVRQASQKYGIAEDLIYAIIKTESSFNPYAVSWANAYGLMQIVPKTAGVDVYRLVKNKPGQPDPEDLFDPAYNIDMGAAYFYLLKTRYLKDVQDPLTLHYAMISAYNGGTGNVLKTFHNDRQQAMVNMNNLQPNQVYWALTNRHPLSESKRYLEKVTAFQKDFNKGNI